MSARTGGGGAKCGHLRTGGEREAKSWQICADGLYRHFNPRCIQARPLGQETTTGSGGEIAARGQEKLQPPS